MPTSAGVADFWVDKSGTITLGGTAQTIATVNRGRRYFLLQNVSSGTLWLNVDVTAVQTQPSIKLLPDDVLIWEGTFVPAGAISLIGATTGQAFTAKEA